MAECCFAHLPACVGAHHPSGESVGGGGDLYYSKHTHTHTRTGGKKRFRRRFRQSHAAAQRREEKPGAARLVAPTPERIPPVRLVEGRHGGETLTVTTGRVRGEHPAAATASSFGGESELAVEQ